MGNKCRKIKNARAQKARTRKAQKKCSRQKSIKKQVANKSTVKPLYDHFVVKNENGNITHEERWRRDRGTNIEQMYKIASNHNWDIFTKERFFEAVRDYEGEPWIKGGCYAAAQEFLLLSSLKPELQYREGFILTPGSVPLLHAWLEWNNQILDLVLGYYGKIKPTDYIPYFQGWGYRSYEVVFDNVIKTKTYKNIYLSNGFNAEEKEYIDNIADATTAAFQAHMEENQEHFQNDKLLPWYNEEISLARSMLEPVEPNEISGQSNIAI